MTDKITLSLVGSLQQNPTSAATEINNNFSTIQTAFDNTLSRDGTAPNTMGNNLDMNSNQILNLPAPASMNSPARLQDVVSNPTVQVPAVGTSGAVVGLLNANKTDSGNNTFSGTSNFTNTVTLPSSTTLVTPILGAATATSINGLAVTTSAGGSLTILPSKAFQVNNNIIMGSSADGVLTFQGTDTYVGRSTTDTLTNKTLTSPTLNTPSITSPTFTNRFQTFTNSLSGDVALNNTSNYFDGPTVAQGTSGTWFVTGTVTMLTNSSGDIYNIKLWDGTTVIASAACSGATSTTQREPVSLSGFITSPAGNLRISVNCSNTTTGKIVFNNSGNSKDSTISAFRIG